MRNFCRSLLWSVVLGFVQSAQADEVDRLLERFSQQLMAEQYSVTVDTQLSEAVNELFDRIYLQAQSNKEWPKLSRKPKVTVVVSNEVNAYSIPGGDIYITTGLCGLTGIRADEVAVTLAHELSHSARQHSIKALKTKLLAQFGLSLFPKDAQAIGKLVWQIFESGRSQNEELEADRDAWLLLKQSGFRSWAPLALFRRLELQAAATPSDFAKLFATHPQISDRTKNYKNWLFEHLYGWDFWIGRAQAAGDQLLAEFANTNEAWKTAYQTTTGWNIYHLPNYFSSRYQGECTWLTYALRQDQIPLNLNGGNNAVTWLERCRRAGYATGSTPKAGAIPVWDSSIAAGAGHVAMIAEVLSDGRLRIWDSNWGAEAKDANYTNGKVRHRIINPSAKISGYIYWPNNQTEAPPGFPGYRKPSTRSSVMLIADSFQLGDEGERSQMVRSLEFELNPAELANIKKPKLRLKIRALPKRDPIISINRQEIGRLVASADGWQTFVLPVPSELLRTNNLLDIESFIPSLHEGYDDCEIKEVELVLS